jgi:flagellar hook-length control protein FliK
MISRIAEKIEELKDMVPVRTVTIRLEPQELGSIDLTVRSRGHRVEATMVAANDWVRSALETHRAELSDQLSTRGLQLSSFDVSSHAQPQAHQQQRQQQQPIPASMPTIQRLDETLETAIWPRLVSLYSRAVDMEA